MPWRQRQVPPALPPREAPTAAGGGPVNFTTLEWTPKLGKHGPVPTARIPAADIDNFVRGEEKRCNVSFYTQATPPSGAKGRGRGATTATTGRRTTPTQPRSRRRRRRRSRRWLPQRVGPLQFGGASSRRARASGACGCKAHFSITIPHDEPDVAEIRYHTVEHTGHDVTDMRAYLTQEARDFVRLQFMLNPDITVAKVQSLNRHRHLDLIRTEHLEWSAEQVRAEFERLCGDANAPRDFFLSRDDINNIKKQVQRDMYLHSRNEANSVHLLLKRVEQDGMLVFHQAQESVVVEPAAETAAAKAAAPPPVSPASAAASGAAAAAAPVAPGAPAAPTALPGCGAAAAAVASAAPASVHPVGSTAPEVMTGAATAGAGTAADAGASSGPAAAAGEAGGAAAAAAEAETEVELAPFVGVGGNTKKKSSAATKENTPPVAAAAATGGGGAGTGAGPGQLASAGAGSAQVCPTGTGGTTAQGSQGAGAPRAPPPARPAGQPQHLHLAGYPAPAARAAAGPKAAMSFLCPNMSCAPRGQERLTLTIQEGQEEVTCHRCAATWNRDKRRKLG